MQSSKKNNSIRELDERLGAICGLAVRGESPASHRDRRGARRCRDTRYSTVHGLPLECPGGIFSQAIAASIIASAGMVVSNTAGQPKWCRSAPAKRLADADMPKTLKSLSAWARNRSLGR